MEWRRTTASGIAIAALLVMSGSASLALGTTPEGPAALDEATLEAARRVRTDPGDLPRFQVVASDRTVELPLRHTHVDAELSGFVARVRVTQTYANPHDHPIEAIYTFPLPENSAVDDMTIRVGDRVIRGEVKPRQEARREYEEAKQAGHTAALLEQERPNVFTQSVANIAPGETIEVELRYVQDLTFDGGEYEFVFPMVVGPRFVPGQPTGGRSGTGWMPDTDEVADASRITPPILGQGMRSGHDITIDVTVARDFPADAPITEVQTPTHAVDLREVDGAMIVSLARGERLPNRDFVLRYAVDSPMPTASVLAHREGEGDGYLSLVLQPPSLSGDAGFATREIIFVVDVSGSMSGRPLAAAKETIRVAVERLRADDVFNLVTFAGQTAQAFTRARPANRGNIAEVMKFLESARAGGGTYMADAVQRVLRDAVPSGRRRIVLFLTDGYIGNEAQIFGDAQYLVDAQAAVGAKASVFGVGIGSSVNRHLIDGLSKAGSAVPLYITNRETPDRALAAFFRYIDRPALSGLKIDWGGLAVDEVLPREPGDLFAGRPLVLHARYRGAGRGTIRVRGEIDGRGFELPIDVTLPAREARHGALGTLWARSRVEELMRALWDGPDEGVVAQITAIGVAHRLVTAYTSFVAVDRSRKVDGTSRTIVQPVEAAEGVDIGMATGMGAGILGSRGHGSGGGGYGKLKRRKHKARAGRSRVSFGADRVSGSLRVPAAAAAPAPAMAEESADAPETEPAEDARRADPPRVRTATPRVSGHQDVAAIRRVLNRGRPALMKCLRAHGAELSGPARFVLELEIAADGTIARARVASGPADTPALRRCLTSQARRWRFPRSGGASKVRIPLVFDPADLASP